MARHGDGAETKSLIEKSLPSTAGSLFKTFV